MYLVTVIPIISVKRLGILSYFSSLDLSVGDLVEININSRALEAIVIKIEDLVDAKQEIRSKDFGIRKIKTIIQKNSIDAKTLKVIENAAYSIGTNTATMLDTLIPNNLIRELKTFTNIKDNKNISKAYISPTILSLKKYYEDFISENKEEKNNTVIFHSELTVKKQLENIEKIKTLEKVNIFCTPSLLPLIKENLGEIHILDDGSRYYKSFLEGLDLNKFLKEIFIKLNIKVIAEDNILSLESYKLAEEINDKLFILEEKEINNKENIINIIKMNDKENKPKSIYFSDILGNKIINELKKEKTKIFLYSQRKGAYTSIICEDCGEINSREEISKSKIIVSGTDTDDEMKCLHCTSYRLKTLGVGTTGIHDYLVENLEKLNLKKENIYIIDSNTIKTKSQAIKIYKEFDKTGGLLIGTEIAVQLLENINLIGIISLDSLFSINDYTLDYEIMRLYIKLNNSLYNRESEIILQTRKKQKIFKYIENKNIKEYIDYELKNRQKLNLPPYSTIITFDMPLNYEKLPSIFGDIKFHITKIKTKDKDNNIIFVNRFVINLQNDIFENLKIAIYENLFSYNLKINSNILL